ncbi:hypothetical protein VZO05_01210 [Aggregatilineales bacterium SYSU G02658]
MKGVVVFCASLLFVIASASYAEAQTHHAEIPVINSLSELTPLNLSASKSEEYVSCTYRLASCDPNDIHAPCYVVHFARTLPVKAPTDEDTITMSSGFTVMQQCGVSVRSIAGFESARLQQNVNVTYTTNVARTPARLNWGDTSGTFSLAGWNWTDVSGPNPSPSWGVFGSSLSAITSGILSNPFGAGGTGYSTRLFVDSSGTRCG